MRKREILIIFEKIFNKIIFIFISKIYQNIYIFTIILICEKIKMNKLLTKLW